jgi:hypothetical protein
MIVQFNNLLNKAVDYIETELPEISYNSGVLNVDTEDPITIDGLNSVVDKIIIDTNVEDEEQINKYLETFSADESGIIILKDKVLVKSSAVTTANTYNYAEILSNVASGSIDSFTKEDVTDYLTGANKYYLYLSFFIVMFIYIFIIYFISVLIDTLVLGILGNITALITKLRVRFSAIYNMAVYALTLSIILNVIYIVTNMFTGFEMKYFQVMYTSVAYIYLVAAIFIIKTDLEKRQGELIKIIEENDIEEVVEEQKSEEEEKNENKDTNKEPGDKKEKEDKKEDKKEENKKQGQEPEGSEA